jgi:hypothetical protein
VQPPPPPGSGEVDPSVPPHYGPPNFGPPGYAPPNFGPPGYAPPNFGPPGYAPPGYAPPGQYGPPYYGQPYSQYAPPNYGQPGYGGYPPPGYVRSAPKPGCVPLRPLALGDILDGAFQVLRRNPRATLGLAAVIAVVQAVCTSIFQFASVSATPRFSFGPTSNMDGGTLSAQLGGSLLVLGLGTLLGGILTGMLVAVVTEDVLGIKLSIGPAWARARQRFWPLVGLSIALALLETVGLFLCLAPGIWLWGIWAVAVPAMMVEGTKVGQSLRRSQDLVSGMFWRVWGIRVLGALITLVIGSLIAIPFTIAGLATIGGFDGDSYGTPVAFILLTAVGSIISLTLTVPVKAAIDSLLYVDLRMRKEGLDLVLQQRAQARTN